MSARDLHKPLFPAPGLPVITAKETDHPTGPGLTRDKDFRDVFDQVRDKDRDEQTSFAVAVLCLAQNVPDNHNLPVLGDGDSLGNIFDSYQAIAWLFPVVPKSPVCRWC